MVRIPQAISATEITGSVRLTNESEPNSIATISGIRLHWASPALPQNVILAGTFEAGEGGFEASRGGRHKSSGRIQFPLHTLSASISGLFF
jgi:hypothetical protein